MLTTCHHNMRYIMYVIHCMKALYRFELNEIYSIAVLKIKFSVKDVTIMETLCVCITSSVRKGNP